MDNLTTVLAKFSFINESIFYRVNSFLLKQHQKRSLQEDLQYPDQNLILMSEGLKLKRSGFFSGKKHIAEVVDKNGRELILKSGRIEPFQVELMEVAQELESEICFKVPKLINHGRGYILMQKINGQSLNECINRDPGFYMRITHDIDNDYKKIVNKMIGRTRIHFNPSLKEGMEWVYTHLNLWGRPLVEQKLVEFSFLKELKKRFDWFINREEEYLFGWFHGNIIGDHIILSPNPKNTYLMDLAIVPRPGGGNKGYYDLLRSWDFLFFKVSDYNQPFYDITRQVKDLFKYYEKEEVRLIFSLRMIGILGWDIIHNRAKCSGGEGKKKLMQKFIKMDY